MPTIEERLAAIESRLLAPKPQAAPPMSIGPFTNVPAPGSPIRSDWPQRISQHIVDYMGPRYGTSGVIGATAGGAADLGIYNNVAATFHYRLSIVGYVTGGQQGAGAYAADIIRLFDGTSFNAVGAVPVGAGGEVGYPMIAQWDVNVGQSGGFKFRLTPTTNMWAKSFTLYTITPL